MAQWHVGLDVHSKFCCYFVMNEDGEVVGEGNVPTMPAALRWLRAK